MYEDEIHNVSGNSIDKTELSYMKRVELEFSHRESPKHADTQIIKQVAARKSGVFAEY